MSKSKSSGIRWLQRSQSCVRILGNWVEAIQSGLFMGLIDKQNFQYFDTYPFNESEEIDLSRETQLGLEPWERQIEQQHLTGKENLIVIAAGGNRELVGFQELGYNAVGIEYGIGLCEASEQALIASGNQPSIVHADRFLISGAADSYDAAFIARKYLSHVHDRTVRVKFLQNIRNVLSQDAILACGYYTREHDGLAFRAQALVANALGKLLGRTDQTVETGDHLDPDTPLYHHHYTLDEVRSELQEAGFEVVDHGNEWFGWAVARAV